MVDKAKQTLSATVDSRRQVIRFRPTAGWQQENQGRLLLRGVYSEPLRG